jgi:hypothetical protein
VRTWSVWAAVAVSIVLRLAWIAIASDSAAPWIDIDDYLVRASGLLQPETSLAGALSESPLGVLRPPLYVGLLSIALWLRLPLSWILVLQAVLAATVVLAVYSLSAEIGGSRAGTIGAWLAACWPQWVTSGATFASEQVNTPLVATALVLTLAAYRRASDRHATAAGLAFAVAALARSSSLYLAPVMAALVATRRKTAGVIMTLALLAVTVPYIVIISRSAGRVVLIENLYEWNWAVERAGSATVAPALSDVPRDIATVIARDPGRVLWSAFSRLKNVLFSEDLWEFSLRAQAPAPLLRWWSPIVAPFLILLYAAGLLGIWHASNRNGALLLVAWIALHCLVVLVSPAIEPRHRTPFEPALMALAAAGLARLYLIVRASGIGGAGRLAQW